MTPRLVVTMLAALFAGASAACAKDSYVYGPAPDWSRYKALGEAAVRAKLPDPDHWAVEWPNGYVQASWHPKQPGYFTCGQLRATAPVEGGYPTVNFVAVVDHEEVKTLEISDKHSNSRINVICSALTARGRLPPAKLMEAPQEVTIASVGLTVRAMPEGAYVTAAAAGSPSQRAGLVPGMVITRANGNGLAGLGSAMAKVLDGDVPDLALETAVGEHFEVRRAP